MSPFTYTFSSSSTYQAKDSDSVIKFYPDAEGCRFVWDGKDISKDGTYHFVMHEGVVFLGLSFNYAREETYKFITLHTEEDMIIGFMIRDKEGRETEFWKI